MVKYARLCLTLFFITVFILFFANPIEAATGILKQINFQGKVVNKTSGTNITDGSYSFTFSIYSVSSGGAAIWTETKSLTVTNGIFQTLLGDTTSLPGSIDFNTDSLYLGINFNSDGEMNPRVRLAAVPYAFNALKVAGLTVTDTTGTLTIPNSSVIAFSGTNNVTFTSSGVTAITLPTSGTLSTLAGNEVLTNKTIGSTGLTFSGAATDITTGTNEALTFTANGTGDFVFTTDSDTTFAVSSLANCDTIDTDANGVLTCGTDAGGAGSSTLQSDYTNDADGSDATITLSSTDGSFVVTNPSSSGTTSAFTVQINQNNTTAAVSVLDLVQASNNANGVTITANAIDGETGLAITANALTSGRGLTINSSATALTGALAELTLSGSNATNTGSILKISNTGTANANTGLYIDNRATGTGNLSFRIDDQSGDTTPLIVDGDGRLGIGTTTISGTTERLLQVGSPTNRGNSATYGELISKGFKQIQALPNIKDVFIYDTSLDSDGGRWIDWSTTDKLSWYTETLDDSAGTPCNISTMDRCYSDAFPRKALLVVTTSALYIFDATNGNMWMKFSQSATSALGADTNNDPSSVTALNGVIYVGTNGSAAGGLYTIDFINDRLWNIDGTDRSAADVGIGSRNGTVTYNSDNNTNFDIATVGTVADWVKINDVSVAVLKNSASPIAAATGPNDGTVVVGLATDSGLTVINLTTQKVTQYSDVTDNDYHSVVVTPTAKLYGLNEALGQLEMWAGIDYSENVATKVNGTPDRVWDENSSPALSKNTPTVLAGAPDALDVIPNGSLADGGVTATGTVASNSDLIYVGTDQGLTEIHDHATAANGWSKFYTTTRQTPLMVGTIRRMHTMDDASGNVTNAAETSIMAAKGTPTYGVQGVRGTAMSFNGTSQYLCSDANSDGTCDNDTNDNMGTGGWTISVWFKHPTTISGTDVLFARCYNATPAAAAGCVAASMTSTGTMAVNVDFDATWTIGSATGSTVFQQSVQTFNDNQWHFLEVTRAATTGNINTMIDGKPIGQTAGVNTTLDAAQIFGIGTDCSTGANCSTGGSLWEGQIDDFQFSANGTTGANSNVTTVSALHRLYNDARPLLNKKVINVTDATTATSTTIGDSAESWIPNEFAGQIVTISGGTGAGQTRRVISNTATVLTVSPAFTTTPDTTSDFKIDPEALYGATNSVTAIGVTKQNPLGEARMMCVGTNSGTDTGGITCYNHQAGPNIVADVFHSDAKQLDDYNTEWTGSSYDNIQSIDITNRTAIFASQAHMYVETQDVRVGNSLDYFQGKLVDVRNQILSLGTTLAGQIGSEIGLSGGADLAEYYYSDTPLEKGDLVAINKSIPNGVEHSYVSYQRDLIGIITTEPGLTLGQTAENAYGVALVGRVPVKVTTKNGTIKAGDVLTSSDTPGVAMKAVQAGPAIGKALEDMNPDSVTPCPEDVEKNLLYSCGIVNVFVNLFDYQGEPVEKVMEAFATQQNAQIPAQIEENSLQIRKSDEEQILSFLEQWKKYQLDNGKFGQSQIFTDKIATGELFADTIQVNTIKANTIEGLEIFTNNLASLSDKYNTLSQIKNSSGSGALITLAESPTITGSKGKSQIVDGLVVMGSSEFRDKTLFAGITEFIQSVIFRDNVEFTKPPLFDQTSAGEAIIPKGGEYVDIEFDTEYQEIPQVVASILLEDTIENTDDLHARITKRSKKGFTIILNKITETPIKFSWIAITVKDKKVFEGKVVEGEENQVPASNTPTKEPSANISGETEGE